MGTLAKHVFVNLEIANSEPYFCNFLRFLQRLNLGTKSFVQIPTNLQLHKIRVIFHKSHEFVRTSSYTFVRICHFVKYV